MKTVSWPNELLIALLCAVFLTMLPDGSHSQEPGKLKVIFHGVPADLSVNESEQLAVNLEDSGTRVKEDDFGNLTCFGQVDVQLINELIDLRYELFEGEFYAETIMDIFRKKELYLRLYDGFFLQEYGSTPSVYKLGPGSQKAADLDWSIAFQLCGGEPFP